MNGLNKEIEAISQNDHQQTKVNTYNDGTASALRRAVVYRCVLLILFDI